MPITCNYLVRLITRQALINDSYVISHNKWYMDKRVIFKKMMLFWWWSCRRFIILLSKLLSLKNIWTYSHIGLQVKDICRMIWPRKPPFLCWWSHWSFPQHHRWGTCRHMEHQWSSPQHNSLEMAAPVALFCQRTWGTLRRGLRHWLRSFWPKLFGFWIP